MAHEKRRPRGRGVPRDAWGAIHPMLDLHGERADEATRLAGRWLRARQHEGERTVVVITGRGVHSPGGGPVLLGEVEHLLRELRGTVVAAFALAPGGGGWRVELLRPPPSPSVSRAAPTLAERADAELRRRAEEALWELGVEPAPALLDAEIRRLLDGDG
ncbi:MAG TPA: Smr/MutS family protein [Longimicrobiaceae bacterium]|nr:Smr/MutS family protein [Longimicrobiaceae bacterium]